MPQKHSAGFCHFFGERMGEAKRWGRSCALACVIIRAETIECTQNAEREISRPANSDCKYGIPYMPVLLCLLCVKTKTVQSVHNEICQTMCLDFGVQLGRLCIISIFYENVNGIRSHLSLSIVGLFTMWHFLDHIRTKETREDWSATMLHLAE